MAEQSIPGLTYSVKDDSPSSTNAVRTASAYASCKGTCQSGICSITPQDAYCCFADWHQADEGYAEADDDRARPESRQKRKPYDDAQHSYEGPDKGYREYKPEGYRKEDYYKEREDFPSHKNRRYHCWESHMQA